MALLAWLSSGSLGTASLTSLGPDPAVVAVLTVVLVAIGGIPAALAPRPPARPSLQVATPTAAASGDDMADGTGVSTGVGAADMTDEPR